ncbi:MAG TPA: hypothetical protein VFX33_01120 [Actinomycetales bacterium]|nr:hypothetical protein [Actinomycetales bacterium]
MSVATTTRVRSPRVLALRVIAVIYAVIAAIAMFGLPSLVFAWSTSGVELPLRTSYVIYGALVGVLVPGLALALLARPKPAVARSLLALLVAVLMAISIGFNPLHLVYVAVIALPAVLLFLLHPLNRWTFSRAEIDIPALAVVGAMAIPTAWYGVTMAINSRTTAWIDDAHDLTVHGQYSQAAVFAFSLLLLGLVGSLRQCGRRIVAVLAAAAAVPVGIAGIVFPEDLMSPGVAGGAATIAAALVFAALALRPGSETVASA